MTPARTPAEVAAVLGVDRRTITRTLVANADEGGQRSHLTVGGEHVPAFRFGRHWRIAGGPLDAAVRGEAVSA
ncbi:MAG: hypothetical protein ACLGI3_14240 [Actinomycetes bacterium]